MPKRWYYITAVRLNASGGQTTHILETCRVLATRRAATLFAPAAPPEPVPDLAVELVALPARPPRELIFQSRVARAVLRRARNNRPDVLYTRAAAFNLGAILAARRMHIPCVLELNGLPALEYRLERRGAGWAAGTRALVYALLARLEGRLSSGIVAVTPQLADEARRWGARHVYVASNGVNPSHFVPGDRLAARRALDLPENAEIVGFAGNFAAWQGLETLVRGALLAQRPALHLLLIGDGVERSRLEELAAPLGHRVRFTGSLPHQAVGRALAACDVLAAPLAPSERNRRTGVSPLKIFEYLALGRPVLASALPGLAFIEHERLGALCTPGDPAALAARLAALLNLPPTDRAAIGTRARAAARGRYSWARITDDVIAFVEELC